MKRFILMAVGAGLLYTPYALAQSTDTSTSVTQTSSPASTTVAQPTNTTTAPSTTNSAVTTTPAGTTGTTTTTTTSTTPAATTTSPATSTSSTTTGNTATGTTSSATAPAVATPSAPATTPAPAPATTPVDKGKVSYSIGVDLGENFKSQGIEVDPDMLVKGIKDAVAGNKLMLTKEEMASTLIAFQKQLVAKQQASFAAQSKKNEDEGNAYMAANKTKPGVVTTPSGLQYKVITAGTGASPKDSDTVTVDYNGTFINGKVFDSSYKRGKPVTFPVSEVIPGWVEAIKLMKPDATYEIVVPPSLGYGDRGLGNVIGPKQTLLFKIHLISVKPAENKS